MRNIRIQNEVVTIVIKKINIVEIICHLINVIDIRSSPKRFRVGGALIFTIVNINHQNVKFGLVTKFLFSEMMLRVWNLE